MDLRRDLVVAPVRAVENRDGAPEGFARRLVLARLQLSQGLLVDLDCLAQRGLGFARLPSGDSNAGLRRQAENQ